MLRSAFAVCFRQWLLKALCSIPSTADPSITMVKRARSKDEVATNQIVKLNVGGRKFHVGKQTLDAFGYMRARLNDGFPLELDDEGHVFVDRDPSIFEVQLAHPSSNDVIL